MMDYRLIAVGMLAGSLLCASPAFAAEKCDLQAQVGAGAQAVYDPFASVETILNVTVRVTNDTDEACQARFYIAPVGGDLRLASGADDLSYRIDAPRGGGAGVPEERGPFLIRVPANSNASLDIPLIVPALQVVPRGDYLAQVEVRGIAEGNQPVRIGSGSAPLRVVVPARVEMSISGTAAPPFSDHSMAPASIDFGEAVSGATERVFVNVWSNGSVAVTLSSDNHGVLRHQGDASLPPIPYTARFDGAPVGLGAPFTVQRMPPASLAGASYPLALTLGDVSSKFAGRYKDVITVAVVQN